MIISEEEFRLMPPNLFVTKHQVLGSFKYDFGIEKVITGLTYILNGGDTGEVSRELLDYVMGATFMLECDRIVIEKECEKLELENKKEYLNVDNK